jgi:hypothetical protein
MWIESIITWKQYVEDAGAENIDNSINKITCNTSNTDDLEEYLHAIYTMCKFCLWLKITELLNSTLNWWF